MKLSSSMGEEEMIQNQKLSSFLATRDQYSHALRLAVQAVKGEELLIDVLEKCCDLYERKMYVVPQDKYMLLRVRRHCQATIARNSRLIWSTFSGDGL